MFSIVTAVEVPAALELGVLDEAAGAGVELAAELDELELELELEELEPQAVRASATTASARKDKRFM
jgi:hypothetical protein